MTMITQGAGPLPSRTSIRSEMAMIGVTVAAIILFTSSGGRIIPDVIESLAGGRSIDSFSATTLVLNIALLLFAWRRYVDLRSESRSRADAEARAHYFSARDPLTGYLNRQSIALAGTAMLAEAGKDGRTVGLCVFNLDRFNNVNDIYGHSIGDRVLRTVGERIKALAPDDAIVARLGGDEFAVAFPSDGDGDDAIALFARRAREAIAIPIELDSLEIHVAASVGITSMPGGASEMAVLLRRADIALHVAKKSAGTHLLAFDEGMENELRVRSDIEDGLRRGIPLGQFVPFYQQQVDLETGRIIGFEVLARWQHPVLGIIEPDSFISIAEDIGLIGDLADSVIAQALEEAKHWDPSLMIAVNISPHQLKDPWLAQKLLRLLTETNFPPQRLEVEITESALLENLELARNTVLSLRNQGISLALDDFGTGYSSLSHLRVLPFDRIKIDRSFVLAMNKDMDSQAIVNAITKLGETMSVPVTAEGIENEATGDKLREIGCDKGQGYHFGRPLSGADVQTLLARHELLGPPGEAPAAKVTPRQGRAAA